MTAFQHPELLKKEESKITLLRGRWIDREFGFEYTSFEINQIKEFDKAKKLN